MRWLMGVMTGLALLQPGGVRADPVQAMIDDMRATCDGAPLQEPDQRFHTLPLAEDGTEILLFDQTEWDCPGMPGLFRHTGGGEVILRARLSPQALEARQARGQDAPHDGVIHYRTSARGWQMIDLRGLPILLLARHGSYCDGAGYMPCVEALTWTDGMFLTVGSGDEGE